MNLKPITLVLLTVLFCWTGTTMADEYKATGKAGDFEVKLTIDKIPPGRKMGSNLYH